MISQERNPKDRSSFIILKLKCHALWDKMNCLKKQTGLSRLDEMRGAAEERSDTQKYVERAPEAATKQIAKRESPNRITFKQSNKP